MRTTKRGYTAVEILSALTLFAIGAAGVIGMQKVTVQGGTDARRFDTATNLANEWVYRLQRDAAFWTAPNDIDRTGAGGGKIDETHWLKDVTSATCSGVNWCAPVAPTAAGGDSSAFDILGHDALKVTSGTGDHVFCAQYRLNWIANPRSGTGAVPCPVAATEEPCITGLIRAEVRVLWHRLERNPIGDCGSAALSADVASNPNDYHFVVSSSTIRQNSNFPDSGL